MPDVSPAGVTLTLTGDVLPGVILSELGFTEIQFPPLLVVTVADTFAEVDPEFRIASC